MKQSTPFMEGLFLLIPPLNQFMNISYELTTLMQMSRILPGSHAAYNKHTALLSTGDMMNIFINLSQFIFNTFPKNVSRIKQN